MTKNVNDWERVASVAAGAGLAVLAARAEGRSRVTLGASALWLVSRGLSGYCLVNQAIGRRRTRDDTRAALGGPRGIFIKERITIHAPADMLFDFWRDVDNLPRVMPFIDRIDRLDDIRSHWVVRGPAGSRLEWDAEIINEVPGELIAWRSLPGADVASAGSVQFRPAGPHSTRLTVVLQYAPAGGRVGAAMAHLFGPSPETQIRRALIALKQTMESGWRQSTVSEVWMATTP